MFKLQGSVFNRASAVFLILVCATAYAVVSGLADGRKYAVFLILVFAIAYAAGCGGGNIFDGEKMVPLEKIPAPVLDAAKKAIPGITFNKAWKSKIEGQDAYEIVGKTKDGKTREVEVSAAGKVLNIE